MKEWIRIETAIKKGEIDDAIIGIIKLKVGMKNVFLLGILHFLEDEIKEEKDESKKKEIDRHIQKIKKSLGML